MGEFIRPEYLEVILSLLSKRDMPEEVREGLRLRNTHGLNYQVAAFASNTTRQAISRGEKKVMRMHEAIYETYVENAKKY